MLNIFKFDQYKKLKINSINTKKNIRTKINIQYHFNYIFILI